jgi:triacylglycerol lipase
LSQGKRPGFFYWGIKMANIEQSHIMAKFALLAYQDGKEGKKGANKLGFTGHKFIDNDGAQVHIAWNDESVVIAFRGTEPTSFNDVKADLNAWPDKAMVGGRVHNGFQTEVDNVWPQIEKTMKRHTKKKIYVCGHSLGGAMATIAASRMEMSYKIQCLYTFGSPRVGNRTWLKNCKFEHYRFVNNNDLVTRVPPAFMLYKHHGTLVYINHYGNIRKMTPWQRIKDKFRGYMSGLLDGMKDHSMPNYVEATEKEYGQ